MRGYKHISHVVDDIAQRITEKERPMPRFNELEVRERGIPGSTGYAVIDADDVDYVKELRETLRKIDSGEARGQVRIQLRAGNQAFDVANVVNSVSDEARLAIREQRLVCQVVDESVVADRLRRR